MSSMSRPFMKNYSHTNESIMIMWLITTRTAVSFLQALYGRWKTKNTHYLLPIILMKVFCNTHWKRIDRIIITLVGAGRGPLILCSLQAAMKAKRNVIVYAIEKNPNAIITLKSLSQSLGWGDRVVIVETDMRTYAPTHYSDIILSELLGSFGDNELSVECLYGTQRFLHQDGIYIPRDCTSYLACCMSTRIYNNVFFILWILLMDLGEEGSFDVYRNTVRSYICC